MYDKSKGGDNAADLPYRSLGRRLATDWDNSHPGGDDAAIPAIRSHHI